MELERKKYAMKFNQIKIINAVGCVERHEMEEKYLLCPLVCLVNYYMFFFICPWIHS